jgi:FkbM family methyltransferase
VARLSSEDHIRLLYRHLLGREADPHGLAHFAGVLDAGHDLRDVVENIVAGEEYLYRQRPRPAPPPPAHPGRAFVIVDLGARKLDDESHIYAPLLAPPNDWRCIGFEPQQHRIAEREAAEGDRRLVLHDSFIGDGTTQTFHTVSEDGSSSLFHLNTAFNADFDDIRDLRELDAQPVVTHRLDDVLREEPRIDFLKLDIQGFEARALSGASQVLRRTNVVHCEVFFGPMYRDAAFFSDIEILLRQAGFSFIDFTHLNRYEYVTVPRRSGDLERLIWGDAVFFRDLVPGADTRTDLQAQAAIASLVYRKQGLAQKLAGLAQAV